MWGLPIAFLAIWTQQIGALILLGIVGIANTVVDVAGMTILQRSVPDQVLARVFGVLESLVYGTLLLGSVIAAALVEGIGAKTAMIVTGALLPISSRWPGRSSAASTPKLATRGASSIFSGGSPSSRSSPVPRSTSWR